MKQIQELHSRTPREIKVVQFGEGNFLRAFVDYFIDVANEQGVFCGDIAVVKPIPFGTLDRFHQQNNLYTVSLRGRRNGEPYVENRVITCIQQVVDAYGEYESYAALAKLPGLRFVVSNTTEAGIVYDETDRFELTPPNTYPGKLTKFLHERFQAFSGAADKGLILLPVELIENNGGKLRDCVNSLIDLWQLGAEFRQWVAESCVFCSTLVDRIVSGYPKGEAEEICAKELGYEDVLLDAGEPFALWVIESNRDISGELPLDQLGRPGMEVIFTDNQKPYRERKVRILNGAHTSCVLAAYLTGKNIVRDAMQDPLCRELMERTVFDEIVPTVKLPREQAQAFADSVLERFDNPFVDHEILSIALNSVSKWKSRILPTFRDQYAMTGKPPKYLTFSFAALLAFYTIEKIEDGVMVGLRYGQPYRFQDDESVMEFFLKSCKLSTAEYVQAAASHTQFWGEDLTQYSGFAEMVTDDLQDIRTNGMTAAIQKLLGR